MLLVRQGREERRTLDPVLSLILGSLMSIMVSFFCLIINLEGEHHLVLRCGAFGSIGTPLQGMCRKGDDQNYWTSSLSHSFYSPCSHQTHNAFGQLNDGNLESVQKQIAKLSEAFTIEEEQDSESSS